MAGKFKYCQFFRFRSPVSRELKLGDDGGAFWLYPSAKYIDISKEMLLEEAVVMGIKTRGSLKVDYLLSMPFTEYEHLRKELEKVKIDA
jgi:hypothetical protein